jgi:GTPase
MLSPENDEGNIEYKRYLVNLDELRIEQLSTQMKWRIAEGEGQAIYYIGINDDGTPYNMTACEKKESLNNFTTLLNKNNAEIINFDIIKDNDISYFKIMIRKKSINYPEIRVVLLGDTGSGKTTFLSNILLNKIDDDLIEPRIYLMNHKHEIETKKTSSINCNYKIYSNHKFVFIEAPGHCNYIKTKYKILLGTNPDIVLIFSNKDGKINDFYETICKTLKIPYLIVNTFDVTNICYCKRLIDKKIFFDILLTMKKEIKLEKENIVKFIILNTYPHNDLGLIVSGYLSSGKLEINKKLNWYTDKIKIKCKINTIHINSEPVKKINTEQMLSVCLTTNKNIKKKYGLLTNKKIIHINKIFFKILYKTTNKQLTGNLIGYCENKVVNISNIIEYSNNIYEATIQNYNSINNKIIIIDNDKINCILHVL